MAELAPAAAKQDSGKVAPPGISLPKGGGVIRGIDEKFGANPVHVDLCERWVPVY